MRLLVVGLLVGLVGCRAGVVLSPPSAAPSPTVVVGASPIQKGTQFDLKGLQVAVTSVKLTSTSALLSIELTNNSGKRVNFDSGRIVVGTTQLDPEPQAFTTIESNVITTKKIAYSLENGQIDPSTKEFRWIVPNVKIGDEYQDFEAIVTVDKIN